MDFYAGEDVPAHRVVNSKGELTGAVHFEFSGLQKMLLQDEGIDVYWDGKIWKVDLKKYGWKNSIDDAYGLEEIFKKEYI